MNILTYQTKFNDNLQKKYINNDPINLFTQFFIHKNEERHRENIECLQKNVKLGIFNIYLLNERIYTKEELQLSTDEMKQIKQININKRLEYSDVFLYTKIYKINGYCLIANSDIFFDITILNLRKSCLSVRKSFYTLLRFEYDRKKKLNELELFRNNKNPIPGSQDVWIYHSNFQPNQLLINKTNILLGKPGCDNTIAYILYINGYDCINEPFNVKTYHNHSSQVRDYKYIRDAIEVSHYLFPFPIIK